MWKCLCVCVQFYFYHILTCGQTHHYVQLQLYILVKTDGKQTTGEPLAEQCWAEWPACEMNHRGVWEDAAPLLPLGATGFKQKVSERTVSFRIRRTGLPTQTTVDSDCLYPQVLARTSDKGQRVTICVTFWNRQSRPHYTVTGQVCGGVTVGRV